MYVSIRRQHTSARPYLPAYVSIRQHTPEYASIRQHTPAYVSIRITCGSRRGRGSRRKQAYVGIRPHMSAYVSIRQHTCGSRRGRGSRRKQAQLVPCPIAPSASPCQSPQARSQAAREPVLDSIRRHTSANVSIRQHTSAYVSSSFTSSTRTCSRQHTSAYVSIRQHTSAVHEQHDNLFSIAANAQPVPHRVTDGHHFTQPGHPVAQVPVDHLRRSA